MYVVNIVYKKSGSFHCHGTLAAVLKRYSYEGFRIKERGDVGVIGQSIVLQTCF